mgnify:CR=1 FL=1|jgi:hypothetical protein
MMKSILGIITICVSLALAAEQVTVPIGEQTRTYELQLPDRSMTKEMVRQTFGEPIAIEPEVGEPPISAWQYEDFVVYFEKKMGASRCGKAPGSIRV